MPEEIKKDEKILTKVPATTEIVKPVEGRVSADQFQKIFWNFIVFTLPIFLGTLFTLLSMGVEPQKAVIGAMVSLYAPLADYFKKRQSGDAYLRDKPKE